MFTPFVSSSPGKTILFGEHAVVHGTHAIATVVDFRCFASFAPAEQNIVTFIQPSMGTSHSWDFAVLKKLYNSLELKNTPPGVVPSDAVIQEVHDKLFAFEKNPAAVVFLKMYCLVYGMRSPLAVNVCTEIPLGAGLGSSAAFAIALAGGFVQLLQCRSSLEEPNSDMKAIINQWGYEGERVLHGNPSGVDNTCCCYGGVVVYQKGQKTTFLTEFPAIPTLLTNTKVSRNTKTLVAGVGALLKQHPHPVRKMIDAIDDICLEFYHMVQHSTVIDAKFSSQMNTLVTLNQCLLQGLGVGHAAIDEIVKGGKKYGLTSKLTGAGGGRLCLVLSASWRFYERCEYWYVRAGYDKTRVSMFGNYNWTRRYFIL